ncbi:MAG: phytanoyl-CoA dioxygenase family protein [Acidimicrobiaceae bacterium]|nr:phytanoyl-CoA dioxygenase family protein [Acidimicrobiaceae bacterium]
MKFESLTDLETRGFVVLRGFLTPEEVQPWRDDHAQLSLDDNRNFNAKTPNADVIGRLTPRFDDVLRQVNEQTTVRADVYVPDTSVYFAVGTAAGVNFPWHQDHESFYIVQNHFDYVNFTCRSSSRIRRSRTSASFPSTCCSGEAPVPTTSSCATARPLPPGRWPVAGDQR